MRYVVIISLLCLTNLLVSACGTTNAHPIKNDAAGDDNVALLCGNNVIDGSEQCDGTELGGATCTSLAQGFTGGTLACAGGCTFDTTACSQGPTESDCANALDDDNDGATDCADFDCCRATACAATIVQMRAHSDGDLAKCLSGATITYVGKSGVYLQQDTAGPAIYFERGSGAVGLTAGGVVSVRVARLASVHGMKEIVAPSILKSESQRPSVEPYVQDLSDGTPLDESFESERIRISSGTLTVLRSNSLWILAYEGSSALISFADYSTLSQPACIGMRLSIDAPEIQYDDDYRLQPEFAQDFSQLDSSSCVSDPCRVYNNGTLTVHTIADASLGSAVAATWDDVYGADTYSVDLYRADDTLISEACPSIASGVGTCTLGNIPGLGTFYVTVSAHRNGCSDKTARSNTFRVTVPAGQHLETFDNLPLTGTTYTSGMFLGNDGISWHYVAARKDEGYVIDGKGLMLRDAASQSACYSAPVAGGISSFSVQFIKAFTGTGNRQIQAFVNATSIGTSGAFDDTQVHTFSVDGLSWTGPVVVKIANTTGNQVVIDNVTWAVHQ
jgi:hypothetical protein